MTLAAVVQHLQVLEASGLVATEKVGRVRTCRIEPKGFSVAERWIRERRSLWERRFDRLGKLLGEPGQNSIGLERLVTYREPGIVLVLTLFYDESLESADALLPVGPFFALFPGMAMQMFVVHFETGSGTHSDGALRRNPVEYGRLLARSAGDRASAAYHRVEAGVARSVSLTIPDLLTIVCFTGGEGIHESTFHLASRRGCRVRKPGLYSPELAAARSRWK